MNQNKLTKGFTNHSYRRGQEFIQEKVKNGFNHNSSYQVLKKLPFVPRLIKDKETEVS